MKKITTKEIAEFLKDKQIVADKDDAIFIAINHQGKPFATMQGNAMELRKVIGEMCRQERSISHVLLDAVMDGVYATGYVDGMHHSESEEKFPTTSKPYQA